MEEYQCPILLFDLQEPTIAEVERLSEQIYDGDWYRLCGDGAGSELREL